jgi:hypothetical protein
MPEDDLDFRSPFRAGSTREHGGRPYESQACSIHRKTDQTR